MQILVLSHSVPYPLHDGYTLRIYHYAKQLYGRHQFDLICFGEGPIPPPLREIFRSIQIVPRTRPPAPPRSIWRRLDVTNPDDLFQTCPAMQAAVNAFLKGRSVDLIWASSWHMPLYAYRAGCRTPIFGDFIDEDIIEAARALFLVRSVPALARGLRRLIAAWRFERRYFSRAALRNLVSEVDAAAVRLACPGRPAQAIPNGVDIDFFRPRADAGASEAPSLVFEGNMSFAPNVDGAVWFVRTIWPALRTLRGDLTLTLVGKDPAPEVQSLADIDGVRVTGLVDDVRDYLGPATAFVCPLRNGAGVKNKILQAWAMGKPVIATPVSCAGLRASDSRNVLLARRPQEWTAAVTRLLSDPPLREQLGSAGRRTAETYYSWEASARRLEQSWFRMLDRCTSAPRAGRVVHGC